MASGVDSHDLFDGMPAVDGVDHHRVAVGDLGVHVAEAGSGPPLVLLHGWPQHWYCWRHVIPALADDFRLVVPDLRGFGWTDVPRGGYAKEQLATDLFGLLDAMDIDRAGLIGHDWGGWVGFLAALRQPARLDGLLALGIVHPFQTMSFVKLTEAWRGIYQLLLATPVLGQTLLRTSPAVVDALVHHGTTTPPADRDARAHSYGSVLQQPARARASVQLYRTFLTRELPTLQRYQDERLVVPTRLIVGAKDPVISEALLTGWEDHADDMQVEVVPGVGHFLPEEIPSRIAAEARAMFGAAVRSRRGGASPTGGRPGR